MTSDDVAPVIRYLLDFPEVKRTAPTVDMAGSMNEVIAIIQRMFVAGSHFSPSTTNMVSLAKTARNNISGITMAHRAVSSFEYERRYLSGSDCSRLRTDCATLLTGYISWLAGSAASCELCLYIPSEAAPNNRPMRILSTPELTK